ncbi:hypothetical protein ACA910_018742 [Epithemia clementina (nom. ined.)]
MTTTISSPPRTAAATTTTNIIPLVELREYALHPQHVSSYLQATTDTASIRKSHTPLCFFALPETGGGLLHVATHAYYYAHGYDERETKRNALALNDEWKLYISKCRPFMQSQQSTLFVEAPFLVHHSSDPRDGEDYPSVQGLASIVNNNDNPLSSSSSTSLSSNSGSSTSSTTTTTTLLELRRYQLRLGYDTVPHFLELYQQGLPSKLKTLHPTSSLVTVLYSEVGVLNQVVEVWRHGQGYAAMEASRQGARQALPWRQAIADIAPLAVQFSTTIHKPTAFSPLR